MAIQRARPVSLATTSSSGFIPPLGVGTAKFLREDGAWQDPPGAAGGESNTASNVGTSGVGVFKQKTGVNLEFKKLNAGSSKVTITDDTGSNEVDIDVVTGTTSGTVAAGDHTHSLAAAWPIGSVYIAVVSTNPATLLGFGTWSAFAAGRVLVGIDAGQTEFDTVEETGGSKTHTLSTAEIPSHTHVQDAHNHGVTDSGHTHLTQRYPTATGASSGFTIDTSMSGTLADNTLPTKSATTGISVNNTQAVNQSAGGGGSHNNLQPYLVVYMWKRTA